jgi:tRNA A-37 threonylcarbamoyl transferase component Bud32
MQIVEYILMQRNVLTTSLDNYGQTALMNSIYSNNPKVFRLLLKHFDSKQKDTEGNTLSHIAAQTGNLKVLKICIEELGIQDEGNNEGAHPLHLAQSPKMIEYLILQNHDINSRDNKGWSALHYNLYLNNAENVKILIQIGANLQPEPGTSPDFLKFSQQHSPDLLPMIVSELPKKEPSSQKLETGLKTSQEIKEVLSEGSETSEKTPGKSLRKASSVDSNLQITPKIQVMLSEILMKTPADTFSLQDFGVEEVKSNELRRRELLGQGAYGKVYRGYFRGSEVAIKEIDTEKSLDDRLAKEFIKEIESLLKIRHNRFLLLLAVCIEGPLCIVTELSKGGNLATSIENKTLTHENKLKVALQIAEGIHYIHSKTPPIVHRDIKPQNILLDEFGQVKIADLGLSRAIEKVSNTEKVNSTRICAGTVRYMAPELYYEEPVCTRATDVWAYGCVLLHMFSENVPWTGLDLVAVQRRLILKQPLSVDRADKLDFKLKELITQCCQVNPDDRLTFLEIRSKLLDLSGFQSSQL